MKGIYPEDSSHAVNHVASSKTDFPSYKNKQQNQKPTNTTHTKLFRELK